VSLIAMQGGMMAGGGDPFYASVISLAQLTGTNGGTSFPDAKGVTWTRSGNAQTSTAQSAGGGSSMLLDGTGDYLTAASTGAFAFGTGDFTVEWYQRQDAGKAISPIDFRGGTSNSPRLMVYNLSASPFTDLRLFVSNADRITAPTGTLVPGAWQHIAVCRASGITRLFVDGVQVGSSYTDSTNYTAADWNIGRNTATTTRDFNGYMQAFRATAAARYTGTFTPPTPPMPEF
jgi:hypothetical protein